MQAVETLPFAAVGTRQFLADKAYDSGRLRGLLVQAGVEPVIPYRKTAVEPQPVDMELYKARHLVENAFADLKHFRGVATRYCKLAATFTSMLNLACFVVNTRATRRGPSPYT